MFLISIRAASWLEEDAACYRDVAVDEALACFCEVYGSMVPGDELLISVFCEG